MMKLDELYDRYGNTMYQFLILRLGSAEEAEDVLQETFCRLARYSLRWALVRNERAFVFKVLRNECYRSLRRRMDQVRAKRAVFEQKYDAAGPTRSQLDPAPAVLPSASIDRALAELPEEQKDVVILKVFQDFSFKEIAAVCEISINTAASRYRYAIDKLRSMLGGQV